MCIIEKICLLLKAFMILSLILMLGYIGFEIYKEKQFIDQLIEKTSCEKVTFFIKEINFNSSKNKYPYYILEYNNKEYYYKIFNIYKTVPNSIDLYFLENNNFIYNQAYMNEKCENK